MINKKTRESVTHETPTNIRQGARYISYAIESTLLQCDKIEKLNTSMDEHKKIKGYISKKDNQYMANRNKETLTRYNVTATLQPLNAIQRQTGTDTVLQILGEIKYT